MLMAFEGNSPSEFLLSVLEKEETKQWKEMKLLKKLEKKRARELMEKEREEAKPTEEKGSSQNAGNLFWVSD